jgi:hypothetical protein
VIRRFHATALGFLSALGAAGTAGADPVQWDLSTLTFQATSFPSGVVSTGTMTGSFTFDADTGHFTTWSIELSGFPGTPVPATGLLLTPANSSSPCDVNCLPTDFAIFDPTRLTAFSLLQLSYTPPLTDAGGAASLLDGLNTVLFLNTPDFSTFSLQGPGSVTATPEPSTGAVVVLVAFGLCLAYQRRRITRQAHSAQVAEEEV